MDSWTEAKASNSHTRRRKTKREVREEAIFAVIADGVYGCGANINKSKVAWYFFNSVADPGCLSRIPDPNFCPSRIPDVGSKNRNKESGEKISGGSHKYQKIENYFIFELVMRKIWANLQRILELFTQKTANKLSKI